MGKILKTIHAITNPKNRFCFAENRKPNAQKRKNRKPQKSSKPKNSGFLLRKPKNRSKNRSNPRNRKCPPPDSNSALGLFFKRHCSLLVLEEIFHLKKWSHFSICFRLKTELRCTEEQSLLKLAEYNDVKHKTTVLNTRDLSETKEVFQIFQFRVHKKVMALTF